MSSRIYPAIPEPNGTDIGSMRNTVVALKQAVEVLGRLTKSNRASSAVTIQDLLDLKIITQDQANKLTQ